jgi:hypothetical protein
LDEAGRFGGRLQFDERRGEIEQGVADTYGILLELSVGKPVASIHVSLKLECQRNHVSLEFMIASESTG